MSTENTNGSRTEPIQLTISSLIADLRNGITRCKGDLGYDETKGSIQEKYDLTKAEVKEIFKNTKLAGIKVKIAKDTKYVLIDDTGNATTSQEETAKFGAPTASARERLAKEEVVTNPDKEGTTNSPEVSVGEQSTSEVEF